jgi:hypothetical protein
MTHLRVCAHPGCWTLVPTSRRRCPTHEAEANRQREEAEGLAVRDWVAIGEEEQGLVRRIREETGDDEELVDYMLRVFRAESESTRTRVEAASWLADRGFGPRRGTHSIIAPLGGCGELGLRPRSTPRPAS